MGVMRAYCFTVGIEVSYGGALNFGNPKVTDFGEANIVLSCGAGELDGERLAEDPKFVLLKVTVLGTNGLRRP